MILQRLLADSSLPEPVPNYLVAPGLTLLLAWPERKLGLAVEPLPPATHGWRLFGCDPSDEGSVRSALGALSIALEATAKGLTEQQAAAVHHIDGPARILAGAGTGKTRVIVARFHHLVASGTRPERILALTFSREAARQMREEILKGIPAAAGLWISTFHSFCLKVLEEGLAVKPRLIQAAESRAILASLAAEGEWAWYTGGRATRMVDEAYELIGHAKDQLLSPDQVTAYAQEMQDLRLQDLAELYRRFQEALAAMGAADFSDFIVSAVNLLESDAALADRWRARFDHILVDEFQDTNLAQFQVLRLLAQEQRNLMVVGDDDQAIYRFRGATDHFMIHFAEEMAGATDYKVEENFRCPAPVLAVANQLIQQNGPDRVEKELYTTTKLNGFPPVRHWVARSQREEAEAIAADIARRLESGERSPADFAILCRSVRRSSPELIRALAARSIPCRLAGGEGGHPAVAQTLALLRLTRELRPADLLQVLSTMIEPADIYAALREGGADLADHLRKVGAAAPMFAWIDAHRSLPLQHQVYQALRFLGHLRLTLAPTTADAERLEAARQLQEQAAAANSLDDLLAMAEGEPAGGGASRGQAVTIMTVHAAKGLQFPVVYVMGLAEGRFPIDVDAAPVFYTAEAIREWTVTGRARELTAGERQAQHWKEERRLAYVALTRAEEELILTRAASYGTAPAEPSRFLAEMKAPPPEPVGERLGDPIPQARHFLVQVATGEEVAGPEQVGAAVGLLRGAPGAVPLRRQAEPEPFSGGESLNLSATALELYRDCPRKYYYGRILGLPEEDSVYLAFGDGLHHVLERFNRARLAGSSPEPADLRNRWEEALSPDRFELQGQYRQFLERGRIFLERYHTWAVAQEQQVIATEQSFSLPYTDREGRSHTIRGRFDLIVRGPGGLEIIDYKSGKRNVNKRATKGSANNADRKLQLGLYYLAHFGDQPVAGAKVTYIFLRHPNDKPPHDFVAEFDLKQEQVISCSHSRESLAAIRSDIDDVIDGILANNFTRTEDGQACDRCPFRVPCEVSKREWF